MTPAPGSPALYVHIPFCETKCPYCDFNSFAVEGLDVAGHLDALRREMDARGVPPDPPTLFLGGGTPTVVEPTLLRRYLADLVGRLVPNPSREFTVEANPGSLTAEKAAILKEFGVNRVSLGAQSFHDRHLRTLGRVHGASQIGEAVAIVRGAGIAQLNLDFIYAVPGQTMREWAETLDRATTLEPDHLSCYALIFEPGTEFHALRRRGAMRAANEGLELAMFRFTERRLRAAGYERYEISNFAKPGRECRHNLNYWRNGSYAGFGAGAFSYLDGERLGNERNLGRYARAVRERGDAIVSRERLDPVAAAAETVALGLRTAAGVDLAAVGTRFGQDLVARYRGVIADLEARKFVCNGPRLTLARRGWRLADTVSAAFL